MHANPGAHDVYLLFLSDLNRIITTHSALFVPVIADIAQWIVRLENIALSRNLVGHMNFPNAFDRQQIDAAYAGLATVLQHLQDAGIAIQIP